MPLAPFWLEPIKPRRRRLPWLTREAPNDRQSRRRPSSLKTGTSSGLEIRPRKRLCSWGPMSRRQMMLAHLPDIGLHQHVSGQEAPQSFGRAHVSRKQASPANTLNQFSHAGLWRGDSHLRLIRSSRYWSFPVARRLTPANEEWVIHAGSGAVVAARQIEPLEGALIPHIDALRVRKIWSRTVPMDREPRPLIPHVDAVRVRNIWSRAVPIHPNGESIGSAVGIMPGTRPAVRYCASPRKNPVPVSFKGEN